MWSLCPLRCDPSLPTRKNAARTRGRRTHPSQARAGPLIASLEIKGEELEVRVTKSECHHCLADKLITRKEEHFLCSGTISRQPVGRSREPGSAQNERIQRCKTEHPFQSQMLSHEGKDKSWKEVGGPVW